VTARQSRNFHGVRGFAALPRVLIDTLSVVWVPAFAGMTVFSEAENLKFGFAHAEQHQEASAAIFPDKHGRAPGVMFANGEHDGF